MFCSSKFDLLKNEYAILIKIIQFNILVLIAASYIITFNVKSITLNNKLLIIIIEQTINIMTNCVN